MDDTTALHGLADALTANAGDLDADLDWFARVLEARLTSYFGEPGAARTDPLAIAPPPLEGARSAYAQFVHGHRLAPDVRLVVLLALIPHVRPQLLDVLWSRNDMTQRGFTEFGGMQGSSHGGFIPTGETAVFLLAGENLATRFAMARLFEPEQLLAARNVLHLAPVAPGEPPLSGVLVLSRELLHRFTTGLERKPAFSAEFPARLVRTALDWDQLVLPSATLDQLEELKRWILHGGRLLHEWGMRDKLRPGFVSLFHGAPGTGKTLSASLIGKHCGCDVYKLDLSMIVSKYIGETEKNLARVFDLAEHKGWILFFDEADALFGSRTRISDAHDRFANQEVSFLLQRVEDFSGVVILASNLKSNIDDAFMRRFQSVVHFPMPGPRERLRIWREAFSSKARLEPGVDLAAIAERHELSGGTIMNVVRYASLAALGRDSDLVLAEDLAEGIRREHLKEGRAL
jgi:ATPase family protein associated with various cellular activities (AAA)